MLGDKGSIFLFSVCGKAVLSFVTTSAGITGIILREAEKVVKRLESMV